MKAFLERWASRIDAMSLRERVIVFAMAMAVVIFVFHWAAGKATSDRLRATSRETAKVLADMRVMQEETGRLVAGGIADPDAPARARIAELRSQVAATETRLSERQRALVPPERIPALLEEILARDRGLELVELRSLAAVPMFPGLDGTESAPGAPPAQGPTAGIGAMAAIAKGATASEPAPAPAPRADIYRHGVEITVRGGYFELLAYLTRLESQPIRMFWKDLELAATDYPRITMKLTVYTLSFHNQWVVV